MTSPPRSTLWVSVFALALGGVLMSLNVYGLGRSVRSPFVLEDPSDFSHERIIPAEEAWELLNALDSTDRATFALRASEIIGRSIKHLPYDSPDISVEMAKFSYMTVPAWENYFLYALSFLRPFPFRSIEFHQYERAIERGLGRCGQQSTAVAAFLDAHGFNTGIVQLAGHVVATAEVEPGVWYVLDPDFGIGMRHSVEELVEDPQLVQDYYARFDDPTTDVYRNPKRFYVDAPPVISYGTRSRYPRASVIEDVTYAAKWPTPAVLLLLGCIGVWSRPPRSSRFGSR